MNMEDDYNPSIYSDDELDDIFWMVDRDKYTERYELICNELEIRSIEYEDLPQSERTRRNLEDEVNAASYVMDLISTVFNIKNVLFSVKSIFTSVFK